MDEFLEDLRKDFTHVGDRFMQFMQTAVQKVKAFDFDSPFGSGAAFTHTMVKDADGIEELLIDIDHGKVTLHCGDEDEIRAEFSVKTFGNATEEAATNEFLKKFFLSMTKAN